MFRQTKIKYYNFQKLYILRYLKCSCCDTFWCKFELINLDVKDVNHIFQYSLSQYNHRER